MRPRQRKHFRAEIDTDAALCLRSEEFEHSPGARAEIGNHFHLASDAEAHHGLLDLVFRHIERPDPVPFVGIGPKIRRCLLSTHRTHRFQTFAIARDHDIFLRDQSRQHLCKRGHSATAGKTVENPAPLPKPFEKPRLAKQLQMTANARLALPQNLRQLGDRQFAARQQCQQTQPRRLTGRPQTCQKLFHALSNCRRLQRI